MDTLFCDSDTQIIENAHENKNIKIKGIIDTSNNPINFEKWTDLFTKWLEKHKWCFGGITSEYDDK